MKKAFALYDIDNKGKITVSQPTPTVDVQRDRDPSLLTFL